MADKVCAHVMPVFVGYPSLEEFLALVDPDRPLYALKVAEPGGPNGGMSVEDLCVHVQQVAPDLSVHYVRLRAASVTLCYGEPFDSDWKLRETAWESLWECVQRILQEYGFTYCRGSIARPKGFVYLDGRSERIAFDKTTKRYRVTVMP